ncbi:hypothetical protein B0H17DRAFT_1133313 [Mycena rosella]|uniref:Helicase C-terminal domain-containing protein n=1 Tax=Mycena rosella TaxID=1033263 RepID=A0AAD7GF45_MYCRO|nr:hypothetical protein B0H17DRAFT_1133313 [Mycena rosella]
MEFRGKNKTVFRIFRCNGKVNQDTSSIKQQLLQIRHSDPIAPQKSPPQLRHHLNRLLKLPQHTLHAAPLCTGGNVLRSQLPPDSESGLRGHWGCSRQDGPVAVTPTGSGKTGFLFLTIIVMSAIAANPSLCPTVAFPKDPAIVVPYGSFCVSVPETDGFQEENMAKLGVSAVMINADSVVSARLCGEDLWIMARAGISMIILGPEQLISKGFQDWLKHEPFFDPFCKAFTQIGFMRARFRSGITMIGLTATLLWDSKVADAIFGMLGVNHGEFYLIRRSNSRHDIQILFRTLHSGIDGLYFPEFAWVLKNLDKTIIFAGTITLVFRLKVYLDSLLPPGVDRTLRVRTHHSLNWADENLETITLFKSDLHCQIIVATNGLAQGNDISVIKTVIQVGEPRAPRCKSAHCSRAVDAENTADAKKEGTVAMDRPVAQIIAARCKPFIQDELYDNPEADSPCICQSCLAHPPATRPAVCRCSGCLPEISAELYVPPPKQKKVPSDIPRSQRLTKPMKAAGTTRLEAFRLMIWFEASDRAMGLTPLTEFLPDVMIKHILDNFARYKQLADISDTVRGVAGMVDQDEQL